jgi:DNA-binding ferritin-like protein (Dps family)
MDHKTHSDRISTLATAFSTSLEKKKIELTATKGGVSATKEILKQHREFLEKSKLELKELVSKSNLNQEVAQYVSAWLSKSTKHIEDYLEMIKSARDIKTGEIVILDNVVSDLRKEDSVNSLQLPVASLDDQKSINVILPDVQPTQPAAENSESAEKPNKKRQRPDQVGKLAETVKRIKSSKTKKAQ